MEKSHTFSTFNELTQSCTFKHRELTPDFAKKFKIANAEYCRILALSEVLNIPEEKLVNQLLSNALGDAHNGFLSAFSNDRERNTHNLQLKQRVKELLLLSYVESSN